MSNFKQKYLKSEVTIQDLDDYVHMWHTNPKGMSLQDFLGLSSDEYEASGRGEIELQKILDAQKMSEYKTVSHIKKALRRVVEQKS